jgi:membrane carboxypeptidase/penicillin-binding protein
MDKKKAHTKAGSQDNPKFKDNSAHNQRLKLLDYLLEHGSITTQQARELLDIYFPPARIKELRQAGYLINTLRESWVSEYGITHSIGRYVLVRKEPQEAANLSEVA